MSKKQYMGLLVVCAVMSMVGGMVVVGLSNFVQPVNAQEGDVLEELYAKTIYANKIVVKEVNITDATGRTLGIIHTNDDESCEIIMFREKSEFGTIIHNGGIITHGISLMNEEKKDVLRLFGMENGGYIAVKNKTGETVVELYADEYGHGYVGAFNREGKGRTLKPGQ